MICNYIAKTTLTVILLIVYNTINLLAQPDNNETSLHYHTYRHDNFLNFHGFVASVVMLDQLKEISCSDLHESVISRGTSTSLNKSCCVARNNILVVYCSRLNIIMQYAKRVNKNWLQIQMTLRYKELTCFTIV